MKIAFALVGLSLGERMRSNTGRNRRQDLAVLAEEAAAPELVIKYYN